MKAKQKKMVSDKTEKFEKTGSFLDTQEKHGKL